MNVKVVLGKILVLLKKIQNKLLADFVHRRLIPRPLTTGHWGGLCQWKKGVNCFKSSFGLVRN